MKAVNPRGFHCVNIMVQKIIGRVKTKAKNRAREKDRHADNPEPKRAKAEKWREDNPDKKKKTDALCHVRNRTNNLLRMKQYGKDNHDSLLVKSNQYQRDRRSYDESFRISGRLRARLQMFLSNRAPKAGNTFDMIGCNSHQLKEHLTTGSHVSVEEGEIDHVFPMSMYRFEIAANQYKAMHFSNLQLLTEDENRNKTNKLPTKAMAARVDPRCWPDGVTMDMLPDIYPGWATPLRMHVGNSGGASSSTDAQ